MNLISLNYSYYHYLIEIKLKIQDIVWKRNANKNQVTNGHSSMIYFFLFASFESIEMMYAWAATRICLV